MSAYLARLKQLEGGKNSQYVSDSEPSKPSNAPFEPFEGMPTARIEKKFIDAKSEQLAKVASETAAIARKEATPEEREVVNWLEHILEDDPVIYREILAKCRAHPDALRFFVDYARSNTVH